MFSRRHLSRVLPQRGAASFVAQLRDTKENSDVLVSLILTKEMLLVARKPRWARPMPPAISSLSLPPPSLSPSLPYPLCHFFPPFSFSPLSFLPSVLLPLPSPLSTPFYPCPASPYVSPLCVSLAVFLPVSLSSCLYASSMIFCATRAHHRSLPFITGGVLSL
jgi:hypothetical protein